MKERQIFVKGDKSEERMRVKGRGEDKKEERVLWVGNLTLVKTGER